MFCDNVNFAGDRNWSMPIYRKDGDRFITDATTTTGITISLSKKVYVRDFRIADTEVPAFEGCVLHLCSDRRNAFIINQLGNVVGGIFSSRESTKFAFEGTVGQAMEFFDRANECFE